MIVPAIILAAGASSRLGQPKQLVRIEGETLLARTIRVVRESGADPVHVVLGANRETIEAEVDFSHVHCIVNSDWEQGISASIRAGIESLLQTDPQARAVLLLVCDQPALTPEHLRSLIEAFDSSGGKAMAASEYAGNVGIPAIFPVSQFAQLLALQGDTGARALLRNLLCPVVTRRFQLGELDIDTPADLALIAEA